MTDLHVCLEICIEQAVVAGYGPNDPLVLSILDAIDREKALENKLDPMGPNNNSEVLG